MHYTNPHEKLKSVALCDFDAKRAYAREPERIRRSNQVPMRRRIATLHEKAAIQFGQEYSKAILQFNSAIAQRR